MANWKKVSKNKNSDPEAVTDSIVMILAGPPDRVNAWFTTLQMDSRFRINTFSTDPQDLETKLGYNPECILLDSSIFSGPESLIKFLTRAQCAMYVIFQRDISEAYKKKIRELPSVKGIYLEDVNLAQVSGRIYADVKALRNQAPAFQTSMRAPAHNRRVSDGLRVITVWSRSGGTGKSTIACALALEASQRGIKTLLIGLSVPDLSIPTFLNLKTTPNLSGWLAAPNFEDGIQHSIQKVGSLDVLVGLQDGIRESELTIAPEEPASINQLVINATFGGYSVVVLDAPVSGAYISAISASNTMVLVSQPMLDQAIICAEAYRMAFKRLRDLHRIGVGNAFVVLNRVRPGLLSSDEWHEAADAYASAMGAGHFPPVADMIPETPEVAMAANAGRSVLTAGEEFSAPIHRLGDMLFGGGGPGSFKKQEEKSFKFGPIRLRKGIFGVS
jgi:arsenite-transporting ATPase